MNLMQLPDESNSKRQVSNEKHIAYRIGLQEISKVIQDYPGIIREPTEFKIRFLKEQTNCHSG